MGAKLVLAVAILGLVAGLAGPARAENAAAAREHYERGTKFYETARYDEAIREFEAAYEAKSDPAFIFNLAQAHRLAGHNQEALQLYRNYLRYVPHPPNRADIDERIRTLEKAVAERPAGTTAPTPGAPTSPAPPPAAAPPPDPGAGTPVPPSATYPMPAGPAGPAGPENQPPAYPPGQMPGGPEAVPTQQPSQQPPPGYDLSTQPAPPPPAPHSSRKKAGIIIGAIGGAFVIGGAVSGLIAVSSARSVEKAASNREAFDPSVERTGRTAVVMQWVGYGVGAAGLAVGLILVATAPSAREAAPRPVVALPLVGPSLGGAAVRMTF